MPTKVIMPQLGESVVEGTVSKWLKRVGDPITEFEPLLEISTDKVDSEIPAPASGVVLQIYVQEGQTVERGVLLALIGQQGEIVPEPVLEGQTASSAAHVHSDSQTRYSPVVARMATEQHLDLTQIKGTGLGGRVTKKDVEAYLTKQPLVPQTAPQAAPVDVPPWEQPISGDLFKSADEVFAKASKQAAALPTSTRVVPASIPPDRPGELVPLNSMRRLIAEHMVRSKLHTAPHVTTVFEVDMSRTMAHWKTSMDAYAAQGVKLTLTAYFVAAMVHAVRAQPTLNAQWTDAGLFIHHNINVGMAVAVADGLIVPVIHHAQDLNLMGLARQVSDLATRARNKTLHPDEVVGGTITLTNHGVSGSILATPIINQPQSAIVGVGAIKKRVVVLEENDAIVIKPMMYATLTFDHRVADGAMADAFMTVFTKTLETCALF